MLVADKLAVPRDINNMITRIASHFKHSTHASTIETYKTRDEFIAPQTTIILNNDGLQIYEVSPVQANYDKDHIEVSNILRPLNANLKHAGTMSR